MKLKIIHTIEIALLCLGMQTACSDETLRKEPRHTGIEHVFNAAGEAYMQFRLQVPMGNFTRSVSPQNGTSAEYAVDLSHSYLILFQVLMRTMPLHVLFTSSTVRLLKKMVKTLLQVLRS